MEPTATSDGLRLQGNQAFTNGEFKKAAKIYRDALKLNLDPVILSNRAMCFIKLNEFSRARRDCEEGLKLESPIKTQIKLTYRLGISLREIGELKKSKYAFQNVLKLDPDNSTAITALTELNTSITMKVENVSTLPVEFLQMLSKKEEKTKNLSIMSLEPSEKVLKSVQELFIGHSKASDSNSEAPSAKYENLSTTEISSPSSMQYLAKLSQVPPHEKLNAYRLVLSIPPTEYQDIFQLTGVEGDFLNFYIEAASTLDPQDDSSWQDVWEVLSLFSSLPRYWLALLYCTPSNIQNFLSKAPTNNFTQFFN